MHARSQKVLALALAAGVLVLFVIFAVGVFTGFQRARDRKKADDVAMTELLELQKRLLAKTKDGLPIGDQEIDGMVETMRTNADRIGGSQGAMYRCGAELIAGQARGGRALLKKLQEINSVLVAKDADREEDLDRRLRLLAEFEALNRRTITRLEGMGATAERCLEKNKVRDSDKKAFLDGMNRKPNARTAQLEIRKIDAEFVEAAREDLTWLRGALPRFHYDAAHDTLVFERNEDLDAYQKHVSRIQEISARSNAASAALVTALESGIARQSDSAGR